ncbi:MAG TPA: hypothetical protein VG295_01930 [Solirubrobacteraceae bacterium]|jgi:hypothetical protein|nr:hypothetical protein [Solirubrobacteraceae bacterium]
MKLSERVIFAEAQTPVQEDPRARVELGQRAARRSLRLQIAKLEREFADAFVTAYPMGGVELPAATPGEPRLLDLAELERVRDDLAGRVRAARRSIAQRGDEQAAKRVLLEHMLLEPGKHRFVRVSQHDLGEQGCGVWHVRPRLGLIGMLMGWWQVKLSSGCPLARGRGEVPRPVSKRQLPQLRRQPKSRWKRL